MYTYCAYSVMLKSPNQVSNSTDESRNKRSSWFFRGCPLSRQRYTVAVSNCSLFMNHEPSDC